MLSIILYLTHWGRVTHICVSDLTSIGSDNGLSPGRRQAIIRTNAGILLIRPLGTNFSEFLVEILIFSFKKMRLKVSSAKRRPFCLGLNELTMNYPESVVWRSILPLLSPGPLYTMQTDTLSSGPRLNIKTVLSTYGDFHVKDKTAVRTSYL